MAQVKNPPLVSYILTCYNHSKFLKDALHGLKIQNYPNFELIINDACSTDNSLEIIYEWLEKNNLPATFVGHKKLLPVCQTMNAAIRLVKGKYIALCSGDDMWLENKITTQVKLLEELPEEYGVAYSECLICNEFGELSPELFIRDLVSTKEPPQGNIMHRLAHGNFIPAITVLIKKACYEKVGLYDESLCYEDFDFWLRTAVLFKFAYTNYPLAIYRKVQGSLNHTLDSDRKYEMQRDNCMIYYKCIQSKAVDNITRKVLVKRLTALALPLYDASYTNSYKYLFLALRSDFRIRTLILFLRALFRIPPNIRSTFN